MRLLLFHVIVIFDDGRYVAILNLVGVQSRQKEVWIDCDQCILDISIDLLAEKAGGQMLQYLRLIDNIVLHQVGTVDFRGHGVAVEDVLSFAFDRLSRLERASDDILEDLLDDRLDELLILVDPDRLAGKHPSLLHLHDLLIQIKLL